MNNLKLLKIANKHGSPLYVYDSNKIKKQYNRLKNSFKSVKNLQINYAVKALSNISILKFIINLGSGIDAVSIQEVNLALKCGIKPEKIMIDTAEIAKWNMGIGKNMPTKLAKTKVISPTAKKPAM